MVEHLVDGARGEALEDVVPYDQQRGYAAQAVEQFVVGFGVSEGGRSGGLHGGRGLLSVVRLFVTGCKGNPLRGISVCPASKKTPAAKRFFLSGVRVPVRRSSDPRSGDFFRAVRSHEKGLKRAVARQKVCAVREFGPRKLLKSEINAIFAR